VKPPPFAASAGDAWSYEPHTQEICGGHSIMTGPKLTFLIGGSDAYEAMTDEFLAAAGGRDARIALLLQGGERWPQYVPHYAEPWLRRGVTSVQPVAPGPQDMLDLGSTREVLQWATGIFVGGGDTPRYHRLYASEPLGTLIRERYEQGVPFAGVSAGAMLAMEHCVFLAVETADKTLQIVRGLNLVPDVIIGVHYTEQNALPEMIEAMARTRTRKGLGIDDGACAVFDGGRFAGVLGQSVYEVEMQDFERQVYDLAECQLKFPGSERA
jgi:cyanophycinase